MKLNRVLSQLTVIACCLLAIMILSACLPLDSLRESPPPSAANPPIYPGAQQLIEQTNGAVRLINFETAANLPDILSYYQDKLGADGWKLEDTWIPLTPTLSAAQANNVLYFSWYARSGEDGYTISVTAVPLSTGKTEVRIKLALDPGR